MSCHNIGRGLNSVTSKTYELYNNGLISKDAARTLIHACRCGVNWCDGNEYEAVDCIDGVICGKCLEKKEKLYSLYDVSDNIKRKYYIADEQDLAYEKLCEECFDTVLDEYTGVPGTGKKERENMQGR